MKQLFAQETYYRTDRAAQAYRVQSWTHGVHYAGMCNHVEMKFSS